MDERTYQRLEDELMYIRFRSIKQMKRKIESLLNGANIELTYKKKESMFGDYRLRLKVEGESENLYIDYIRDNEERFFITSFM